MMIFANCSTSYLSASLRWKLTDWKDLFDCCLDEGDSSEEADHLVPGTRHLRPGWLCFWQFLPEEKKKELSKKWKTSIFCAKYIGYFRIKKLFPFFMFNLLSAKITLEHNLLKLCLFCTSGSLKNIGTKCACPEMEVTEIILAKVSKLCQLSSHSYFQVFTGLWYPANKICIPLVLVTCF